VRAEVGAAFDRFGGRAAVRGEGLLAALLDGQVLVAISQAAQQGSHLPDLLPRERDQFQGSLDRYGAALCALEQVALERATALRAMGVDAAPRSTQSRAGLRQQAHDPVLVLDFHPHDLEPGGFRLTDQLDVGEQGAVTAQPALRA